MAFKNSESTRHQMGEITYFMRPDAAAEGKNFYRIAVQTHFIMPGESYIENLRRYVLPLWQEGDILSVSEKIIAVCQQNIVDIKDVKIGFWAKLLAKFARATPAGPGVSTPSRMQLAIDLAGLPRIILASFLSMVGKIFGRHGVFYSVAGHGIAGVDGFYPKASFDLYKTTAVLIPREPDAVCAEIERELGMVTYIVDASDIDREILGRPANPPLSDEGYIDLMRDNPAGQDDELTPFILLRPAVE